MYLNRCVFVMRKATRKSQTVFPLKHDQNSQLYQLSYKKAMGGTGMMSLIRKSMGFSKVMGKTPQM